MNEVSEDIVIPSGSIIIDGEGGYYRVYGDLKATIKEHLPITKTIEHDGLLYFWNPKKQPSGLLVKNKPLKPFIKKYSPAKPIND